MVSEAPVSLGCVKPTKDVTFDSFVAYRLASVTIMDIDVIVVKDIVCALNLCNTVLVDNTTVTKEFPEVVYERTTHKLHHPHLVFRVHNELST